VKLIVSPAALKALSQMPKKDSDALLAKLEAVADKPFGTHPWAKRLQGSTAYRVRHGDWRAIYHINADVQAVVVDAIGNRKEIYR
jgi:mRNA-degrading endonuclease RelE of RelBE toxin-antitoxin system